MKGMSIRKGKLPSNRTHHKVPKMARVKKPPNSGGKTSSTFRRGRNF